MSTRTPLLAPVIAMFAVMPSRAARQALVTGNDNCTSVSKLQTAGNDAAGASRQRLERHPGILRSAARDRTLPVLRTDVTGMRIARTL